MMVLIVDRDEVARDTMLRRAGSWWPRPETHAVATVGEARRFAASMKVDIAIVEPADDDVWLLARELAEISPAIRFILHTDLSPEHPDVMKLRRMGTERVIHKGKSIEVQVEYDRQRHLV